MVAWKFYGDTCGFPTAFLLEKIGRVTRQVQSKPNDYKNKRHTLFVERVSFNILIAAALGKFIALLSGADDDRHDCIARLYFCGCRGFSAAVLSALFPKYKDNALAETLELRLSSMSALNSFLEHLPKNVSIANVWHIEAPVLRTWIAPEEAREFAHHLKQVQGISQLYLDGFIYHWFLIKGQEHRSNPVLLLAKRIASRPPTVVRVNVWGTKDAKTAKIIRMLSRKSIQHIFTSVRLTGELLSSETFAALGEWLTHPNCRLQSLVLFNVEKSSESMLESRCYYRPFLAPLARQETIKHLYMADNLLDDSSASDVARVLCQNTSLESWGMSMNWFGRDGMEILTNALKQAGENFRSVQLLGYREMLERGWTRMFVDALKANPHLRSVTLHNQGKGSLPASTDPPSLIQEYHYYLSLNRAGRPYFYIFEGEEATSPPVTTTSPLPLALWPHLLARAARVTSDGISEGDLIYRMLRDGPLVQEMRNLQASRRTNTMSRKRRRC